MNSREATNYLKAFAILAVCLNHFINLYVTSVLKGYANGFLAIFFLLSGYGIYHSLAKQREEKFRDFLIFFFKKRFIRIYPLLWIWCILHGFPGGIVGFFALDFIHPKQLWFIPAIIECYIVAPFLFLFFNRVQPVYSFIFISLLIFILNIILFWGDYYPSPAIGYRNIFFLHIFQFFLGFFLSKIEFIKSKNYHAIIAVIFFLFFVQETTPQSFIVFIGKDFLFPILLSLSTFYLCHAVLSINIDLPFKKTARFIGIHTYSIYLFHTSGFYFLDKIGIICKHNTEFAGIVIWALTLPLFVLVYAALETIVNEFVFGNRRIIGAFDTYLNYLSIKK